MPTSPAVKASRYGPVNLGLDAEGNSLPVVEGTIAYFDGTYFRYATDFGCGSFDYAPGASSTPTLLTKPASFYRTCGTVIHRSDDLMNWTFVNRFSTQDPYTGRVYINKKPRVVYSAKTKLYTMWFGNGQGSIYSGKRIMQSTTPIGPWSAPRRIDNQLDPTDANLLRDFDLAEGPNGETWMAVSHGEIRLFRLNDELTGVVEQVSSGVDTRTINGGIGMHYENGWWYVTGSTNCGNCVGAKFSYAMARNPRGPWTSPSDNPTTPLVEAALLSEDSGYAQSNGSATLPDGRGGTRTLIPFKHYISSATGAPGNGLSQPGDANLALGGQWWYPLAYDDEGRILPMQITPSSEFPLATPVRAKAPPVYQADMSVSSVSSIVQKWVQPKDQPVASIRPTVFQRTPDISTVGLLRNPDTFAPQDPTVNAPLLATLTLPDGSVRQWTLDPRAISWAPSQVALNLERAFAGGGEFILTLSTNATNGSYGVAVGPALPGGVYQHVVSGTAKTFPNASMFLRTSVVPAQAPKIVNQPKSVAVLVGAEPGFVVGASNSRSGSEGVYIGYQWKRNGEIILAPDGMNESTAPTLRLDRVTKAAAGTYTVDVFNTAGSVRSEPAQLHILDVAISGSLAAVDGQDRVTFTVTNREASPISVLVSTEWGSKAFKSVAPGETVSTRLDTNNSGIVLGEATVSVTQVIDRKEVTATQLVHFGKAIFNE